MNSRLCFNLFVVLILLQTVVCKKKSMSKTFMYFAYGSNLLAQRIHINSPSAVRKGCGMLRDYRLDFNLFSNRWKGASATVVPTKNSTVWGAIWEIDLINLANLDKQEGVDRNIYFGFEADIETPEGKVIKCRCYQQCQTPLPLKEGETLPDSRKPSAVYLNTIIQGAAESNLPEYYQNYLKKIPHNGYDGKVDLQLNLNA